MKTGRRILPAALLLMGALVIASAGCLGKRPQQPQAPAAPPAQEQPEQPQGAENPPPEPAKPQTDSRTVSIYLARWPATGEPGLEPVKRSLVAPKGASDSVLLKLAIESLIAGPTAGEKTNGLSGTLPRSAKVLSVKIASGIATVDFSREMLTKASTEAPAGSTGEALALESIKKTASNFPSIARVKITIEGKSKGEIDGRLVEDFWGHVGLPEYLNVREQSGTPGPAVQSVGKAADGLAIKAVRWSNEPAKFRLVLDLVNVDGTAATQCPVVRTNLSASAKVISIEVNGIRAIGESRLIAGNPWMLNAGPATSLTLQKDEASGDDQRVVLSLALDPTRSYGYKLFALSSPVRVVIDVFPK